MRPGDRFSVAVGGALCFFALLSVSTSVEAQIAYTEEAIARGVNYGVAQGDWESGWGCGVALSDLDNDGDDDLIVTGQSTDLVGVYENDGSGNFTSRTSTSGLPVIPDLSGVVTGDYDADGDLDLYVTQWRGPAFLFQNQGGFVFTDVTSTAGVGIDGAGMGAAFADYDGDGWLDLYVALRTYPHGAAKIPVNVLYRNDGDGTFTEVGASQGVDDASANFQPVFFDYDHDGDVDLYVTTDKGLPATWTNRLWRNDNGNFVDQSTAGANVDGDLMGVAVGDFDGNGYLDIYTTNVPTGNFLLLNQGDGTFVQGQTTWGVTANQSGWGTIFFDYDLDGREDLYVVNNLYPNMLFTHSGTPPATEVAASVGLADIFDGFCIAMADIDNDGDIDVVVQNIYGNIRLYISNAANKGAGNWLKVRLAGSGNNTFAIGARVEIEIGGVTQQRQVQSSNGYKSSSSLDQHFGVGAATTIDRLTVYWPGGGQQDYFDVATNQTFNVAQAASSSGAVPDSGSTPLTIAKGVGGELDLAWGASCNTGDVDYGIYEGTLGDFTSHESKTCTTSGNTFASVTPQAASSFYLVVPTDLAVEGSYGTDSGGTPRPQGANECRPQSAAACL